MRLKELCLKTGFKIVCAIFSENFTLLTLLLHCKQSSLKIQITDLKSPKHVNMSRSSAYSIYFLCLNSSHTIGILKSPIFWHEKSICFHAEQ